MSVLSEGNAQEIAKNNLPEGYLRWAFELSAEKRAHELGQEAPSVEALIEGIVDCYTTKRRDGLDAQMCGTVKKEYTSPLEYFNSLVRKAKDLTVEVDHVRMNEEIDLTGKSEGGDKVEFLAVDYTFRGIDRKTGEAISIPALGTFTLKNGNIVLHHSEPKEETITAKPQPV